MSNTQRSGPKISILIVTYNSSSVIGTCLTALEAQNNSGIQVIVVDNKSSDGTVHLINENFPAVQTVENPTNAGFAAAVNRAATYAEGQYIVLLNPDAQISPNALAGLISFQEKHASVCITAPLIVDPNNRLRIVSAGRFPTIWRMLCHYSGLSRLGHLRVFEGHYLLPKNLKQVESVEWVTGAALAISSEGWRQLGGLSEKWFMYAEDIEFCWRAKNQDIDIFILPEIHANHLVGHSTGEPGSMKADWVVNLYDFYRTSISSRKSLAAMWKIVVAAGLFSRAGMYKLFSIRVNDPSSTAWAHEAKRFAIFGIALIKTKG